MLNILKNSFRKDYAKTMALKVVKRFEKNTTDEATSWAKANVKKTTEEFCKHLDPDLYAETVAEMAAIKQYADKKLSALDFSLGGGGNYTLLYFLIRKFTPAIVVETGVAAGWSSLSILRALKSNGSGKLYSSDFPYFRLENPEQYVGFLVKDEENIADWDLDMRGDDNALPAIAAKIPVGSVGIFHYDSDKSYSGRVKALKVIEGKLAPKAIIIFDDIQDNLHFRDLVTDRQCEFRVFEFEGKFVGVIGV